jgi:uncharacterized protein
MHELQKRYQPFFRYPRTCAKLKSVSQEENTDSAQPATLAADAVNGLTPPALGAVPEPAHEDPPWTGWDVTLLAGVAILAINVFVVIMLVVVAHLRGLTFAQLAKTGAALTLINDPHVLFPAQLLGYAVLVMAMVGVVRKRYGRDFFPSLSWRWPGRGWTTWTLAGMVMALIVNMISRFVPVPKSLPIERYFENAAAAYILSAFGILVAPLVEEMFFRGFLYPVLARRTSMFLAVVATAFGFMLIHANQLANSWGPLLLIFTVGVALTLTRAITRSLASSVIMHMSYNATLFLILFVGTSGFRHMERI